METTPKPNNPRKIAGALAKAIKELDRVCFESNATPYTNRARKELFDALLKLGYSISDDYKLEKVIK